MLSLGGLAPYREEEEEEEGAAEDACGASQLAMHSSLLLSVHT